LAKVMAACYTKIGQAKGHPETTGGTTRHTQNGEAKAMIKIAR
jgi:hypothetical protein